MSSYPLLSYSQISTSTNQTKLEVLTEKVDLLENINTKILNSIYWTLGILASIFLAIITLNFFTNSSVNEKKIRTLKDELENEIKQRVLDIQEKNNTKLQEEVNNIDKKIKNITESEISNTSVKLNAFEDELIETKRDLLLIKYEEFKARGQNGEFSTLIDILDLGIRADNKYHISKSLHTILEYCRENNVRIGNVFAHSLLEILKKLPADYKQMVEQIEKIIYS